MSLNKLNKAQYVFNTLAILLVVAALIAVVFTSGARAEVNEKQAAVLKNNINGNYQKSLDELVVLTGELQNSLAKVQIVGSPYQFTMMLSEIWRTSGEAGTALCSLPGSCVDTGELNAFYVRAGDYAYTLLKKTAQGTPLANSDMEQLASLHNTATGLVVKLQELQAQNTDYADKMAEYDFYGSNDQQNADAKAASSDPNNTDPSNTGDNNTGNEEYPHLIYDGPFSESTELAQPLGVHGEECDEAAGAQKAKEFLGDLLASELTYTGRCEGKIPTHNYTGTTKDGTNIDVEVTVTGGHCLTFRVAGIGGADGEKPDEATGSELAELGRQFLEARGLVSMTPTYAQYYGSAAVINYAYVHKGAIVYSDLIKVWVDINSKTVVGMEASGFYNCHKERSLPAPSITEGQAMDQVSPVLAVKSVKLALIPISVNDERLCYEFKCTYGEDSFIVYVNALTGVEEQVFRIIDSKEGQLVV